jgi:hypothetical protein
LCGCLRRTRHFRQACAASRLVSYGVSPKYKATKGVSEYNRGPVNFSSLSSNRHISMWARSRLFDRNHKFTQCSICKQSLRVTNPLLCINCQGWDDAEHQFVCDFVSELLELPSQIQGMKGIKNEKAKLDKLQPHSIDYYRRNYGTCLICRMVFDAAQENREYRTKNLIHDANSRVAVLQPYGIRKDPKSGPDGPIIEQKPRRWVDQFATPSGSGYEIKCIILLLCTDRTLERGIKS